METDYEGILKSILLGLVLSENIGDVRDEIDMTLKLCGWAPIDWDEVEEGDVSFTDKWRRLYPSQ